MNAPNVTCIKARFFFQPCKQRISCCEEPVGKEWIFPRVRPASDDGMKNYLTLPDKTLDLRWKCQNSSAPRASAVLLRCAVWRHRLRMFSKHAFYLLINNAHCNIQSSHVRREAGSRTTNSLKVRTARNGRRMANPRQEKEPQPLINLLWWVMGLRTLLGPNRGQIFIPAGSSLDAHLRAHWSLTGAWCKRDAPGDPVAYWNAGQAWRAFFTLLINTS